MSGEVRIFDTFNTEIEVKIAEDPDEESYCRCPIEQFGKKMLESMGWFEGRGVGKKTMNSLIKPVEYIPRHHRLGLGATPKPIPKQSDSEIMRRKKRREKDSDRDRNSGDYYRSSVGSLNVRGIGEKMEKKERVEKGSEIYIVNGKHGGLFGRVVGIGEGEEGEGRIRVELAINDQIVSIYTSKVKVILAKDKDKLHLLGEYSQYTHHTDHHRNIPECNKLCKNGDGVLDRYNESSKSKKHRKLRWVKENILVRIICKRYKGGRLYNKKVRIQDILSRDSFCALTDTGEILDDLREKQLETVMPPLSYSVMVLRGKHRGILGKLIQREKGSDVVKVSLQLENGEIDVLTLSLDDCSSCAQQ